MQSMQMDTDKMNKEKFQKQIREVCFAAQETALYLNSHPNDTRVLERHNHYCQLLHELNAAYLKQYNAPLANIFPASDYWTYIEGPWPWQERCLERKEN